MGSQNDLNQSYNYPKLVQNGFPHPPILILGVSKSLVPAGQEQKEKPLLIYFHIFALKVRKSPLSGVV